jgi:hypothetical protein
MKLIYIILISLLVFGIPIEFYKCYDDGTAMFPFIFEEFRPKIGQEAFKPLKELLDKTAIGVMIIEKGKLGIRNSEGKVTDTDYWNDYRVVKHSKESTLTVLKLQSEKTGYITRYYMNFDENFKHDDETCDKMLERLLEANKLDSEKAVRLNTETVFYTNTKILNSNIEANKFFYIQKITFLKESKNVKLEGANFERVYMVDDERLNKITHGLNFCNPGMIVLPVAEQAFYVEGLLYIDDSKSVFVENGKRFQIIASNNIDNGKELSLDLFVKDNNAIKKLTKTLSRSNYAQCIEMMNNLNSSARKSQTCEYGNFPYVSYNEGTDIIKTTSLFQIIDGKIDGKFDLNDVQFGASNRGPFLINNLADYSSQTILLQFEEVSKCMILLRKLTQRFATCNSKEGIFIYDEKKKINIGYLYWIWEKLSVNIKGTLMIRQFGDFINENEIGDSSKFLYHYTIDNKLQIKMPSSTNTIGFPFLKKGETWTLAVPIRNPTRGACSDMLTNIFKLNKSTCNDNYVAYNVTNMQGGGNRIERVTIEKSVITLMNGERFRYTPDDRIEKDIISPSDENELVVTAMSVDDDKDGKKFFFKLTNGCVEKLRNDLLDKKRRKLRRYN